MSNQKWKWLCISFLLNTALHIDHNDKFKYLLNSSLRIYFCSGWQYDSCLLSTLYTSSHGVVCQLSFPRSKKFGGPLVMFIIVLLCRLDTSYILHLTSYILLLSVPLQSIPQLYLGLLMSPKYLQGRIRYVLDMSLDINRLAAITQYKLLDHTHSVPARHCTNHI